MNIPAKVQSLVDAAIDSDASDLHLSAGVPPILRVFGAIRPVPGWDKLTPEEIKEMLNPLLMEAQREELEERGQVDFSFGVRGVGRFRCNISKQRGSWAMAMRVISATIKPLEELGLPEILHDLAHLRDGLILVTGPTGSGKSTTLASMIDIINRERQGVIITLEDPIEFLHNHKNCVVNQREVGTDTTSFAEGLRAALRSDPDVILVGRCGIWRPFPLPSPRRKRVIWSFPHYIPAGRPRPSTGLLTCSRRKANTRSGCS